VNENLRSTEDVIDRAARKLIDCGLASPNDLKGCTPEEIATIESVAGVILPETYKRFLEVMGKSTGSFLEGTDFLYPDVMTLRAQADALARDSGGALSLTDFVFAGHQGYEFLVIECKAGLDPPVRRVSEAENPAQVFPSFSEWLSAAVSDEVAATDSPSA
jgi:SMI1/KNR4 family protein SUKH-1